MSRMSFQTKSIPYQPPKEKVVQGENMVVVTTEDETAYWRDNENVYYRKKIIPGADPNSFRYIVDTVFAIDKNTAYANEIPF